MRFTLYETLNGHRDKFLAKIAGCTDFHFSRMINGHKQIADEYVERLADYFGVPKEKMEYALRSLREERIRRASKS